MKQELTGDSDVLSWEEMNNADIMCVHSPLAISTSWVRVGY